MKTTVSDPWSSVDICGNREENSPVVNDNDIRNFEDSFVSTNTQTVEVSKLPDSEEYLARLQHRLKTIKGGTSKRDLINSLSIAKEDCIARLITDGRNLETAEEIELAANPLIRHIAPHLQALTPNELVHLLKADFLQAIVDEQNQDPERKDSGIESSDSQSNTQDQDNNEL